MIKLVEGGKIDISKRYWIFESEWYYPGGGMSDFVMSVDTVEEVIEYFTKNSRNYSTINALDSKLMINLDIEND